jgi:hypothetical protein
LRCAVNVFEGFSFGKCIFFDHENMEIKKIYLRTSSY